MDWTKFLSTAPAGDYVFQDMPYDEQIKKAAMYIKDAKTILIGAGAGLSAAAGLTYSGWRFEENFREFIEKYGMSDMYSAGFYPFSSEEARWGYWSKHIMLNRVEPIALPLYKKLFKLVEGKDYFVLTTNVDHQFHKAGFDEKRIFATQGDYGLMQCSRGCHNKVYDAVELVCQMDKVRKDCLILSELVPRCPVCGGPMTVNIRCDQHFVEDDAWSEQARSYGKFLDKCAKGEVLLLEMGVGFNTPIIIRFPFDKLVLENKDAHLLRLNLNEAVISAELQDRVIGINENLSRSITDIADIMLLSKPQAQEERLTFLLESFKEDSGQYKNLQTGSSIGEKRSALRSLMNIRMPGSIDKEVLDVQDDFLKEEAERKGIVDLSDIATVKQKYGSGFAYADKISLWQGDITRLKVDAIVNAANSQMLGCFIPCHGCIDNAIHSAAGIQLREECYRIMQEKRKRFGADYQEPTGKAEITDAYNLPCKYVIHTVGPIVSRKLDDALRADLRNCYTGVLECAVKNGAKSIAFCCISTGEFHFPNDEAAKIAVAATTEFMSQTKNELERVVFNVFKDEDMELYEAMLR